MLGNELVCVSRVCEEAPKAHVNEFGSFGLFEVGKLITENELNSCKNWTRTEA